MSVKLTYFVVILIMIIGCAAPMPVRVNIFPEKAYSWDGKTFVNFERYQPVTQFPILKIKLKDSYPDKYYRLEGAVSDVGANLVETIESRGCTFQNKTAYLKSFEGVSGYCYTFTQEYMGKKAKMCVVSYILTIDPVFNQFTMAHEEMHAINALGIQEAFDNLKIRFSKFGYNVRFENFESEELSDIVGFLHLMELKLPLEGFIAHPAINPERLQNNYKKLQSYKIAQ
jgi:hypothetical protein